MNDMLNATLAYFSVLGNADASRAESRKAGRVEIAGVSDLVSPRSTI
jgi:hypothetical protein